MPKKRSIVKKTTARKKTKAKSSKKSTRKPKNQVTKKAKVQAEAKAVPKKYVIIPPVEIVQEEDVLFEQSTPPKQIARASHRKSTRSLCPPGCESENGEPEGMPDLIARLDKLEEVSQQELEKVEAQHKELLRLAKSVEEYEQSLIQKAGVGALQTGRMGKYAALKEIQPPIDKNPRPELADRRRPYYPSQVPQGYDYQNYNRKPKSIIPTVLGGITVLSFSLAIVLYLKKRGS